MLRSGSILRFMQLLRSLYTPAQQVGPSIMERGKWDALKQHGALAQADFSVSPFFCKWRWFGNAKPWESPPVCCILTKANTQGTHIFCQGIQEWSAFGSQSPPNHVSAAFVTALAPSTRAGALQAPLLLQCHHMKTQPVPVPLPRSQTLLDPLSDGSKLKGNLKVKALLGLLESIPWSCESPG